MRASTWPSRRKRVTAWSSSQASVCKNFKATSRPSTTCSAATTTPIAPAPSTRAIWYLPAITSPSRAGRGLVTAIVTRQHGTDGEPGRQFTAVNKAHIRGHVGVARFETLRLPPRYPERPNCTVTTRHRKCARTVEVGSSASISAVCGHTFSGLVALSNERNS
jgi:hypothetical protein